jgi:uncharacterized oligopeptide transporter (OPT) family protein
MAISTDILRTWRGPRRVIREMLDRGPREDRLIFIVMVACFLMFVAQLPVMARLAFESEQIAATNPDYELRDLQMLIGSAFFGWLMIMPLVLYLVAGVSFLLLRLFRQPVTGHSARLVLFWSVLAASPVALLAGLMNGLNGPGSGTTLVGVVWIAVFCVFWILGTRESVARPEGQPA